MSISKELNDVLKGLVSDILKMERAYYLHSTIGENSAVLNEHSNGNFGELFGAIQDALVTEAVLAVSRVYDNPSKQYPTRCIRRALELLTVPNNDLPDIIETHNTKLALHFLPNNSPVLEAVEQGKVDFVNAFVPAFRSLLDSAKISSAVERLKNLRDKSFAHNEAATPVGPTWQSLKSLIVNAQHFVGVLGWAFCNIVYTHEGEYFLTSDAKSPSIAMRRLVKELVPDDP